MSALGCAAASCARAVRSGVAADAAAVSRRSAKDSLAASSCARAAASASACTCSISRARRASRSLRAVRKRWSRAESLACLAFRSATLDLGCLIGRAITLPRGRGESGGVAPPWTEGVLVPVSIPAAAKFANFLFSLSSSFPPRRMSIGSWSSLFAMRCRAILCASSLTVSSGSPERSVNT